MNAVLADRSWLAAERFTIADIALLPYTMLADEGGFDLSDYEHAIGWVERCVKRLGL